jgi:uncharacterized protein YrrD
MNDNQANKKWSELYRMAVVTLADGKKVGTFDDFYFDPDTHTVYALRVKTGLFAHKALHVANLSGIGQDAITTKNEEMLQSESDDARLSSLPRGQNLLSYKVMSTSGNVIGTLGHVLLDISKPTALRIAAIELSGGLQERLGIRSSTLIPAQFLHYGHDVLVVPEEALQSPQ